MTRGRKSPLIFGVHDKSVDDLATRANNMGVYTVESLKNGVCYFIEDGMLVISSSKGYMKTDIETAKIIAKELCAIIEDVDVADYDIRIPMDSKAISKMLEV